MPRKKRKKIQFTEDSVNEYMQEVYDDSFRLHSKISLLYAKWEAKVKDGGDVMAMGDSIVKLIGAMAKNQEQKIAILKILKDIVFVDSKKEGNDNSGITNVDKEELMKRAEKALKDLDSEGILNKKK